MCYFSSVDGLKMISQFDSNNVITAATLIFNSQLRPVFACRILIFTPD